MTDPARRHHRLDVASADHCLALDVGTQSVRAILFDPNGSLVAMGRVPIEPYLSPQPGWAEQDPEVWWTAVGDACRKLWASSNVGSEAVVGVALTTQRVIPRHNVTKFRQNPYFPVNTLMLMRGAVAAQFEGVFEPYFRAAYHHMWEEPKKMDDLETFRNAFISSGIDIDRLIARAQQDDVKKGLIDRTTDAINRGAFGSPTFFVGKEMFFGKDQLRDVEESIVEQTSQLVSKTA